MGTGSIAGDRSRNYDQGILVLIRRECHRFAVHVSDRTALPRVDIAVLVMYTHPNRQRGW